MILILAFGLGVGAGRMAREARRHVAVSVHPSIRHERVHSSHGAAGRRSRARRTPRDRTPSRAAGRPFPTSAAHPFHCVWNDLPSWALVSCDSLCETLGRSHGGQQRQLMVRPQPQRAPGCSQLPVRWVHGEREGPQVLGTAPQLCLPATLCSPSCGFQEFPGQRTSRGRRVDCLPFQPRQVLRPRGFASFP